MMNTVKNVLHSFDGAGQLAKEIGGNSADVAKRVGSGVSGLATKIGAKRGLVGLAILGAVVGSTIFLVRYLRNREPGEPGDTDAKVPAAARRSRQPRTNHAQA